MVPARLVGGLVAPSPRSRFSAASASSNLMSMWKASSSWGQVGALNDVADQKTYIMSPTHTGKAAGLPSSSRYGSETCAPRAAA